MIQGQTAMFQGHEVCLFPLDYIDVTQAYGPGTSTHKGGYAVDYGFPSTRWPIYAPCSCHVISPYDSYAGVTFCSDNPVYTPSGFKYVTFRIVHDEIPLPRTSFRQGELIAHSGQAGQAFGDHCHLDQSLIQNDTLRNYGTNWSLSKSTPPQNVFFLTGDETVVNLTKNGITLLFRQWHGAIVHVMKKWIVFALKKAQERKRRNDTTYIL